MKRILFSLVVLLCLAIWTGQLHGQLPAEEVERVSVDESFPLIGWPDGDAAAGEAAFLELKCTQCHSVPSVPKLRSNKEQRGPALVGHAKPRARLLLVRQIVAPGTDQPNGETHMQSYADLMTVKQLTDLVAFLECLDREAGSDE